MSQAGRHLIKQIGPISILLEFLDIKDKLKFNSLCQHVYRVVMPGISGRFVISNPKEFPDWLDWGKGANALEIKLQRSLNVRIGNDAGICYGV